MTTPTLCGAVWLDGIQLAALCVNPATAQAFIRGRPITICTSCADLHAELGEGLTECMRLVGKHYGVRVTDGYAYK